MKNTIGKDFDNLAQRSINYFLATYPSFYPSTSSDVDAPEQKAAYEFIKGIYLRLYDDPALFGFKSLPDDSLGDREQQKDKLDLLSAIRKPIKKTEEFIVLLGSIVSNNPKGRVPRACPWVNVAMEI
ncbi:MAG: hypothetical protein JW712_02365 [Dehalococcoidales bacterium]|nr:hypothetical protein [Dehalococcoidales bacterium]